MAGRKSAAVLSGTCYGLRASATRNLRAEDARWDADFALVLSRLEDDIQRFAGLSFSASSGFAGGGGGDRRVFLAAWHQRAALGAATGVVGRACLSIFLGLEPVLFAEITPMTLALTYILPVMVIHAQAI